jgi:hypothetical protein
MFYLGMPFFFNNSYRKKGEESRTIISTIRQIHSTKLTVSQLDKEIPRTHF